MHAIVLAGGNGVRLRPHTLKTPKALMKVGSYPIVEIILRRLAGCGFSRVTLCVSYLGDQIKHRFGDGSRLGLSLDYCTDRPPAGTAAPLVLVEGWDTPALIINGDILTTADFGEIYNHHANSRAALTVVFQRQSISLDSGVIIRAGDRVLSVSEKPSITYDACSGIYVANPDVRQYMESGDPVGMPDLIASLVAQRQPVSAYEFTGEWHDIGTPATYASACHRFMESPGLYLHPSKPRQKADGNAGAYVSTDGAGTSLSFPGVVAQPRE